MNDDDGFTVIELLATCLIVAVVVTLGAYATGHYWKVRALNGAVEEVTTELRGEQQDASSQSHPHVWGAWFKTGTNRWGIVRGNIKTGICTVTSRRTFPAGVEVQSASFSDITTLSLSSNCTTAAESGAEIVLFLARGTATAGSVSLRHPQVSGGTARTITVSPITGRVTKS